MEGNSEILQANPYQVLRSFQRIHKNKNNSTNLRSPLKRYQKWRPVEVHQSFYFERLSFLERIGNKPVNCTILFFDMPLKKMPYIKGLQLKIFRTHFGEQLKMLYQYPLWRVFYLNGRLKENIAEIQMCVRQPLSKMLHFQNKMTGKF